MCLTKVIAHELMLAPVCARTKLAALSRCFAASAVSQIVSGDGEGLALPAPVDTRRASGGGVRGLVSLVVCLGKRVAEIVEDRVHRPPVTVYIAERDVLRSSKTWRARLGGRGVRSSSMLVSPCLREVWGRSHPLSLFYESGQVFMS